MTVLGKSALIARLRGGELVVSPILSEEQIGAASIDLRMGTVVLMVRARGASHVEPLDAKQSGLNEGRQAEFDRRQKHERFEIPYLHRFLLHPGSLALVPTLEWVKLPKDLIGSVTARSTWAREGLSIATATLVEPGYQGIVTLELANLGQIPIALYPGLKIAQIAFTTVEGETKRKSKPQFELSFEPYQGSVAKQDEYPFIPAPDVSNELK
ncbi:dCTP deaminase [Bradyrhizobium yuanmingense]|uniref:dCTP deaminase n=1 Tax=Bradyrhizobium yuanmingense TaxID=108015 RepID=UPI000FE40596|nr:dCTP deaminase [Bradyrhizobium yuanmingense]TGN78945.1 dCTP deaminase [Bradyrhizobium yuanmingense]